MTKLEKDTTPVPPSKLLKNWKLLALIAASVIAVFTFGFSWYFLRNSTAEPAPPTGPKPSKPTAAYKVVKCGKFMLERNCIEELPGPKSSYKGLVIKYDTRITDDWIKDILIPYFKAGKRLDIKSVYMILLRAQECFAADKALVHVPLASNETLTVVGDVHGQFFDVLEIFKMNNYPSSTNKYLFNGDIVDRGDYSIECLLTLLSYKVALPKSFFMTRGNHETASVNTRYGFLDECKFKYTAELHKLSNELMLLLPFAYVIKNKIFVVHGGLTRRADFKLTDFETMSIYYNPPTQHVLSDLLWSDPREKPGIGESSRGAGILFGPDITEAFLKLNNLDFMIRSHEELMEGYKLVHNNKCLTVFSAPNYGNRGNVGAYAVVSPDLTVRLKKFSAAKYQGEKG